MKKTIATIMLAALSMGGLPAGAAQPGDHTTTVKHAEWVPDAVIYEMNLRQGTPGRNLRSASAELKRLKDLGVDIVWLMPLHPISEKNRKGTLGSYYAVKDYKAVNPEFGTMADLKDFVDRAHSLGMKVILDEVCNHSGADNVWIAEHPDYYVKDKEGNFVSPYDWTDTYKLDYSNPKLREAMLDALEYWVKEADIDGYRCDVAFEVPVDFWVDARKRLDKIKPVFMLAESDRPELVEDAFDAVYAWPMKDVFNAIAATKGVNKYARDKKMNLPVKTALSIDSLLNVQKKQFVKDSYIMNMVTNHDLNSWEGTELQRYGKGLGAFAVLSYTLPGMPMMYTGQEVGFDHPFEFFEADPVIPDYTPNEVTSFYEMLNALRHNEPALRAGQSGGEMVRFQTVNPDIYAFARRLPDNEVIVIANLSDEPADVKFKKNAPVLKGKTDYFTGSPAKMPSKLQPWEYHIYTVAK